MCVCVRFFFFFLRPGCTKVKSLLSSVLFLLLTSSSSKDKAAWLYLFSKKDSSKEATKRAQFVKQIKMHKQPKIINRHTHTKAKIAQTQLTQTELQKLKEKTNTHTKNKNKKMIKHNPSETKKTAKQNSPGATV